MNGIKRVLVTGGTGVLGSALAKRMRAAGYTVRSMSRRPAPDSLLAGSEWAQADLETGSGLAAAVAGAELIVHAASSPFQRSYQVDVAGTQQLVDRAREAGCAHLLYVSIVGIEHLPFEYYRHKLAAEQIIARGALPWSIVRATQFFGLLDYALRMLTRFPIAFVPGDFLFQPVDPGEVADVLCALLAAPAAGRAPDIAGPEVLRSSDMAHSWLAAQSLRRLMLPLYLPGRTAAGIRRGDLTRPDRTITKTTWDQWLAKHYGKRGAAPAAVADEARKEQT